MRVRDRLNVSERRQVQATRAMELALVGFVFVGVWGNEVGVAVNSAVALAVTKVPAVLERDYEFEMDPALVLWITTAVFLHAFGTLGPPGGGNLYRAVPWWDHMTHALSSSLVAAVGYSFARAVDEHAEDVSFPPAFMLVFILLVVLAFGVLWEVIEFVVAGAATALGTGRIITQYGIGDTMLDLVFNAVGGAVVAVWGTAHLTDVVGAMREHLEGRAD